MTRSCNKYRTGFPPLWLVFLGIAFFGTALGQMPISSSETGDSLGQIRQAVGLELLKEKALDPFIVSKRAYIEKFGSEPHHRVVLKQALKCNKSRRLREQIYMPIPGDSFLFAIDEENSPMRVTPFREEFVPSSAYDFYLIDFRPSYCGNMIGSYQINRATNGQPILNGIPKPSTLLYDGKFFVGIGHEDSLIRLDSHSVLPPVIYLGEDFESYDNSMSLIMRLAHESLPEGDYGFRWLYEFVQFDAYPDFGMIRVIPDSLTAIQRRVTFVDLTSGQKYVAEVKEYRITYHLVEDAANFIPSVDSAYRASFSPDPNFTIEFESRKGARFRYRIQRYSTLIGRATYRKGKVDFEMLEGINRRND